MSCRVHQCKILSDFASKASSSSGSTTAAPVRFGTGPQTAAATVLAKAARTRAGRAGEIGRDADSTVAVLAAIGHADATAEATQTVPRSNAGIHSGSWW